MALTDAVGHSRDGLGADQAPASVARLEDLVIQFRRGPRTVHALRGVSFSIARGEIVGLVGESGSGKTVLGLALLGLLPAKPAPFVRGQVIVGGSDMLAASAADRRRIRRTQLGAVFQDPMTSLNPTMRIGRQVEEVARSRREAIRLLEAVGLPDAGARLRSFPHELSGGMRQRVMIAMAVATSPALIVADEPTTALDVTVQAQVLDLLKSLRDEFGCSLLLITHDLGVASEIADRVVVLYGGRVAEIGATSQMLTRPQHPYTAALLQTRLEAPADRSRPLRTLTGEPPDASAPPPGCPFAPRCPLRIDDCTTALPDLAWTGSRATACIRADAMDQAALMAEPASWPEVPVQPDTALVRIRQLEKTFAIRTLNRRRTVLHALRGVDLEIAAGEAVALVGESGSGKTTLLRTIAGLYTPDHGEVSTAADARPQIVYQDAGASLTPWLTVGELLEERIGFRGVPRRDRREKVAAVLGQLGLSEDLARVRASQLSGGQRQRVALARAVIGNPRLLLCDEPTSALDASLAATVLNLIGTIRRELGISVLFVTHDLAAASAVADRIAVLYLGRIVEIGPSADVISQARHPYTRTLLASLPRPGRAPQPGQGEAASPLAPPDGCAFHPRCPVAIPACRSRVAKLVLIQPAHLADCIHLERQ